VKASHFQLGYQRVDQNHQANLDDEIVKQKWNPKFVVAKTNLAKSNWSVGNSNNFEGIS
jgi:hypothetical protein